MAMVIVTLDAKKERRRRRELGLLPLGEEGPTYMDVGEGCNLHWRPVTRILSMQGPKVNLEIECVKSFSMIFEDGEI